MPPVFILGARHGAKKHLPDRGVLPHHLAWVVFRNLEELADASGPPVPIPAGGAEFEGRVTTPVFGFATLRAHGGTNFALGLVSGAEKASRGIYAHHYFAHADAAWLSLYR